MGKFVITEDLLLRTVIALQYTGACEQCIYVRSTCNYAGKLTHIIHTVTYVRYRSHQFLQNNTCCLIVLK